MRFSQTAISASSRVMRAYVHNSSHKDIFRCDGVCWAERVPQATTMLSMQACIQLINRKPNNHTNTTFAYIRIVLFDSRVCLCMQTFVFVRRANVVRLENGLCLKEVCLCCRVFYVSDLGTHVVQSPAHVCVCLWNDDAFRCRAIAVAFFLPILLSFFGVHTWGRIYYYFPFSSFLHNNEKHNNNKPGTNRQDNCIILNWMKIQSTKVACVWVCARVFFIWNWNHHRCRIRLCVVNVFLFNFLLLFENTTHTRIHSHVIERKPWR